MRKLLILFLPLLLLCSCKSKQALNFSEEIVKKENSLENDIKNTEAHVKSFLAANQYDSMAVASEKMANIVDTKLNEIKALKTPDLKYAGDFKANAIEYFNYIKDVYTSYAKFAKAGTDELREKEYSNMQDVVNKKDEVIRKMRDAQKKFAEANGFKLRD